MRHGLDLVEIGVRMRMWVGVTVMVEGDKVVVVMEGAVEATEAVEMEMVAEEKKTAWEYVTKLVKNRLEAHEDIQWAILNSKEFLFQH